MHAQVGESAVAGNRSFLPASRRCLLLALRLSVAIAYLIHGQTPRLRAEEPATSAGSPIEALVAPLLEGGLVEGLAIGIIQPVDQQEGGAAPRLVDATGVAFFGFGRFGGPTENASKAPDADTLFEIGSITKTFTGLLLANMVERGEVQLDEPVAKLLPEMVKIPRWEERDITLVDLATHTSGLPRMPNNFSPARPADPYADYSADRLFEFLASYNLRRAPGEKSVYSNLGLGLLGEALARRARSDYETLLRERIWQPLGMPATRVKLDEQARARLAAGHDYDGVEIPPWEFEALVGAGGIRSSARDMVAYLRANLMLPDGAIGGGGAEISAELRKAVALSQEPRMPVKVPPGQIALAWMIQPDGKTVWHNGQTGGYHSYAAFDRSRGIGVVVLSNTATGQIDRLGQQILDLLAGNAPTPLTTRKIVALEPAQLEACAGKFDLDTGVGGKAPLTITFEKNRLWAQLPLQPRAGIYPSSDTEFFYKAVDAQIRFVKDSAGEIAGLVLRQNGRDMQAEKIKATD